MPKQPVSTVKRRKLGNRLRKLRGERRMADFAATMGWSEPTFSRAENGKKVLRVREVRRLLELYGVDEGQRRSLLTLAREAQQVGWWHEYSPVLPEDFGSFVDFEDDAAVMSIYEPTLVPGLFQTEEYAKVVLRAGRLEDSDEEIAQRVEARTTRAEILSRDRPPRLMVVMEEAVLRRVIGGSKIMHAQLEHLLELGSAHNVIMQVVPRTAALHGATGAPFVIFDFADEDMAAVVYSEQRRSSVYIEREDTVRDYALAFAEAQATALSHEATAMFITECMKEL